MKSITNLDQSPLPLAKMKALLPEAKKEFREGSPFPHIVIDDFFHLAVADKVLSEFPGRKDIDWMDYYGRNQIMLLNRDKNNMGPFTNQFISALNSPAFITFLEEVVGIPDLLPDHTISGGGQHNIVKGGKMEIHIDYNKHRKNNWERRVNLILYLNKDWKEEFEGQLELWDSGMQKCIKKIRPLFNRLVIFNLTETSFHGYPKPLKCPKDRSRKSIALYYYTQEKNEQEVSKTHNTLFQTRPGTMKMPDCIINAQRRLHQIIKKFS